MNEPLHYLSIAEVGERLRTGRLSPVELTRAILERIEALDGQLHAYITVTADSALDQARQAEAEIAQGNYRGPLHGIPIAYKDIVWTKGIRTTAHSKLLADWVPDEDATIVTRFNTVGAISLGKLSLHEFACGTAGPDDYFPPARNPWDVARSPGGSSSGSGTAVAAGLAMGAIGTDTGGSVRHPAAVCGLVGMKATYGRVSLHGVIPLSGTLDHIGPLTRTVRDNALMLQAMAGQDPRDPSSVAVPVPDFLEGIDRGLDGLRLGVPESWLAATAEHHHPEVLAAFETAKQTLRDLGAEIRPVEIPGLEDVGTLSTTIMLYEAYAYHKDDLEARPDCYTEPVRTRVGGGARYTASAYQAALRGREQLIETYAKVLQDVDVIINPGQPNPAVTMEELRRQPIAVRGLSTRMYNVTGLPALVLPMGFSADGLPLSLQFAGRPFEEPLIYQAAAAYEVATRWSDRHPAIEPVTA